jgi:hypothetical protein
MNTFPMIPIPIAVFASLMLWQLLLLLPHFQRFARWRVGTPMSLRSRLLLLLYPTIVLLYCTWLATAGADGDLQTKLALLCAAIVGVIAVLGGVVVSCYGDCRKHHGRGHKRA